MNNCIFLPILSLAIVFSCSPPKKFPPNEPNFVITEVTYNNITISLPKYYTDYSINTIINNIDNSDKFITLIESELKTLKEKKDSIATSPAEREYLSKKENKLNKEKNFLNKAQEDWHYQELFSTEYREKHDNISAIKSITANDFNSFIDINRDDITGRATHVLGRPDYTDDHKLEYRLKSGEPFIEVRNNSQGRIYEISIFGKKAYDYLKEKVLKGKVSDKKFLLVGLNIEVIENLSNIKFVKTTGGYLLSDYDTKVNVLFFCSPSTNYFCNGIRVTWY
ncbi:MAG: hypothetical protein H6565_06900 [Lewinellaceae bacterium]|nr:hypothetical protein [Lewinellaceae bacterium]MCB9353759.1 hypothetical protein [Lewinellaceae bacterium]